MTQQITFQYALKLLNQKEEDFLQQASQVRERKTQLLGALRFLGILDLLDFPEDPGDPGEEDKKDPEGTSPESIDYFGQTESVRQPSKLSPDFSSKTGPPQGESIYERAHQKAYQEAMGKMRKEALEPQTLFPDPKESLDPQGNDPSEWLLDRANASCDEILTGSTTLQELLDNLDNLDGIRFNQDIIREFLAGLFNPDSVDKEPSNFDSVPGYPSTTEEIGPGTADQGSDIRDPAAPDSDPAIPYPYSDIKNRPIPDSDIRDPATPDSDPAIPDSDIRDPDVPDSLTELRPNFRNALNLGEKMERVGVASQGKTLSPNEVAKLLIDQGQYRSRMRNIRYQVRRIMRDNPLQYEKIGEDTFVFISPSRKTPRYLPA